MSTRTLAIDYGIARIGLALSDERKIIASPWKTIQAKKKIKETIALIKSEIDAVEKDRQCTISKIVVGMPLRMNGHKGIQADEVQAFVDELQKALSIPIVTWDERLTTVQAERALREGNMSRKKRTKVVDNIAASLILQNYLDCQNQEEF